MVMLGWSDNLTTLFLDRLYETSYVVNQYSVPILLPVINNCHSYFSRRGKMTTENDSVQEENDHRKVFMINFHKSMWLDQISNLVPQSDSQSDAQTTALHGSVH